MSFCVVCYLVAHAGSECELPAVSKFRLELSFGAQEYVAFDAPMVREITRRVLNHPDANISEVPRPPVGHATLAFVFGALDLRPVGGREWDSGDLHDDSSVCERLTARRSAAGIARATVAPTTLVQRSWRLERVVRCDAGYAACRFAAFLAGLRTDVARLDLQTFDTAEQQRNERGDVADRVSLVQ